MDEGRLSKLPAPLLRRILSFLPLEEAVKTYALFKPWRLLGKTRPNFNLAERDFRRGKQRFMDILDKSLQVYSDQNLGIEDFRVTSVSKVDPELQSLFEKWIPTVVHDLGAKKFHLSFGFLGFKADMVQIPSALFESESLQELNLRACKLRPIFGNNDHLKTLFLRDVFIEDETNFAKFLSSCSSIEDLSLVNCNGLRSTINMPDHHNLKSIFVCNINNMPDDHNLKTISLCNYQNGIYLPIGFNYSPRLTCLRLTNVHLSNEFFNSFSRNFPCLEELELHCCNGFDEFQLSSPSIKKLDIKMDESTNKAAIDAPSIKWFSFGANISQSISVATISSEWESQLHLTLDIRASLWLPKISELVAAFSQSQISSLTLYHPENHEEEPMIGHLSDINSDKPPFAMENLGLVLDGVYYDSFHSDLMNGLFRIIRPREIEQLFFYKNAKHDHPRNKKYDMPRKRNEVVESLCRALQMGISKEDEGMSFWQQDLEEASLKVQNGGEWYLVPRTINWSEYVATIEPLRDMIAFCYLCFQLKWREEADNSFDNK